MVNFTKMALIYFRIVKRMKNVLHCLSGYAWIQFLRNGKNIRIILRIRNNPNMQDEISFHSHGKSWNRVRKNSCLLKAKNDFASCRNRQRYAILQEWTTPISSQVNSLQKCWFSGEIHRQRQKWLFQRRRPRRFCFLLLSLSRHLKSSINFKCIHIIVTSYKTFLNCFLL